MSKKFYKIEDFFPLEGDPRFSLSAESPLDEVTYNIFSADDFADAAIYDYGERSCLFPETDTPLASFYSRFSRWKAQRGADLAALYGATKQQYDPLTNYNSVEHKTGTETGLQTPNEWVKTTSRTPDLTRTETQTPTNWTNTKTETPTNWQEQTVESYSAYKETETQKPANWTNTKTNSYTDYTESTTDSFGKVLTTEQSYDNFHDTTTVTPTNKQTTDALSFTNYHETNTETPANWVKETTQALADNQGTQSNKIVPFNGSSSILASEVVNDNKSKTSEEQKGTLANDLTKTGTQTHTITDSGYVTTDNTKTGSSTDEATESGETTHETTITGTKALTEVQSGTFANELTKEGTQTDTTTRTGTYQTAEVRTGTFETEETTTGSDDTTETQEGTYENKMTYNTTLTREGNIGTMTPADMLAKEAEIRLRQLVRDIIREFFDTVSVYVQGA